jgi:hypothetical protein
MAISRIQVLFESAALKLDENRLAPEMAINSFAH